MHAAEQLRSEGYYWIRRNEPDGPPFWEVARFAHHNFKYEDRQSPKRGEPLQDKIDQGPCWWVCGSPYPKHETKNPLASNAWKIIEPAIPDPGDR